MAKNEVGSTHQSRCVMLAPSPFTHYISIWGTKVLIDCLLLLDCCASWLHAEIVQGLCNQLSIDINQNMSPSFYLCIKPCKEKLVLL